MEPWLVRVRMNCNRCPFDARDNEKKPKKKPKNDLPDHVLVYSGPETDIEWTAKQDCPGPFWRVHESSVRAAFGRYYDNCPPVYVCGHQIDLD